jgi:hexosaminidase
MALAIPAAAASLPLTPYPAIAHQAPGALTLPATISVATPPGDSAALADATWLADETRRIGGPALRPARGPGLIAFRRSPGITLGPEGYRLDITAKGVIVSASTDVGLFHGAATLLQLLTPEDGAPAPLRLPLVHIEDRPRFAWRGLMLDSARHMQSTGFIEALIDQMARYKLNVLHWHLTDDQGWRIPIDGYPRLTTIGAFRVEAGLPHTLDIDPRTQRPRLYGGFYTKAEIRRVVAYAKVRGIEVVPEIEMPGHASAAILAYPDLGLGPVDPATSGDWGVFPNLYAPSDHTFGFLEHVLSQVMDLFPGRFIHVGGDEAVKDVWKASPEVQARIKALGLKDEDELQSWFINRIGRFLKAHGRRLIGWDEILQGGLPEGAAVMSWHGVSGGMQAAGLGHDAVLTPGFPFYFDNRLSPAMDEPPGRGLVIRLADVYAYDPAPSTMDAATLAHVLGVQANLWTEHIRLDQRVEHMAFPRAIALAEIAWTPQAQREWPDFLGRLQPAMKRDQALGLAPAQGALDPEPTPPADPRTRDSHQLTLCTTGGAMNLEAPGPVDTDRRAVRLADVMNPCWIWKDALLDRVSEVTITASRLPFNFQIGADAAKVPLSPSLTPDGEFEIRLDGCAGQVVAGGPMPPTRENPEARTSATLRPTSGRHDLCVLFTRPKLDPWWALGSVTLSAGPSP